MSYRVSLGLPEWQAEVCEVAISRDPVDWWSLVWLCLSEDAKVYASDVMWASRFNAACLAYTGEVYPRVLIDSAPFCLEHVG